ncbi:hypothetical protein B0J11DRAFT_515264 [Dendryphion nanum]|uniref:C2H2-type domain-containing protein n=1 Tax=Dendryphion nanum TaxID=256645 RepID=A0A9P9EJ28_9PLEO|nr:hypothetical protein B0J11DRAFT_515264 [Dendryphion nanum]
MTDVFLAPDVISSSSATAADIELPVSRLPAVLPLFEESGNALSLEDFWDPCQSFPDASLLSSESSQLQLHQIPRDSGQCHDFIPGERLRRHKHHSLPRRRSKYLLRASGNTARAMEIKTSSLRPQSITMQRWQNSPPEDEAVSLSAIQDALNRESSNSSRNSDYSNAHHVASSTTSFDCGTSHSSLQSTGSDLSAVSSSSWAATPRRKKDKKQNSRRAGDAVDRIFKCTFCCDSFKHKYDWTRHEKSLHLTTEEWRCSPHGASVISSLTGRAHCAYCNLLDPDVHHIEKHNHMACCSDGRSTRTFRRKDHLVQHLRLFHHVKTLPLIEDWKFDIGPIRSRCGFCNVTLESWDERSDHLANHFRKGKTMNDWQGDHGFDESVAARVTNSLPPYLLATESTSQIPHSATNPASYDLLSQIYLQIDRLGATPPTSLEALVAAPEELRASCVALDGTTLDHKAEHQGDNMPGRQQIGVEALLITDVLARHLSRFARQQMTMGIAPTDEMFQRESRRVLFDGDEDDWNQTIADNQTWLKEFRQRYGFEGDMNA